MCVRVLSRSVMPDSVTPWTVAARFLCPWDFSRQEYRSGLPFSPPGDLPDPGMEPASLAFADRFFTTEPLRKPLKDILNYHDN